MCVLSPRSIHLVARLARFGSEVTVDERTRNNLFKV